MINQLNSTDVRDLEIMLGMLEDMYQCEIPAAQRILKKLNATAAQARIVPTGLCSARSIRLN